MILAIHSGAAPTSSPSDHGRLAGDVSAMQFSRLKYCGTSLDEAKFLLGRSPVDHLPRMIIIDGRCDQHLISIVCGLRYQSSWRQQGRIMITLCTIAAVRDVCDLVIQSSV
jgi:hypothetical protein